MDFPTAPESPSSVLARLGGGRLLPALGLLLYAVLLAYYMGACAGGPDSAGYLNNARLLSQGRLQTPIRALADPPPRTVPASRY